MRLDGYGLFVKDMATMIRFYRDILGFKIKEDENTDKGISSKSVLGTSRMRKRICDVTDFRVCRTESILSMTAYIM